MILFVFEGGKGEPTIFDSIEKLFLSGEELRVVHYYEYVATRQECIESVAILNSFPLFLYDYLK